MCILLLLHCCNDFLVHLEKAISSLYYLGWVETISLQSAYVEDVKGMPNHAKPFWQRAPEHPPTQLRCVGAPNTGRTRIRGCLEIFAASVDNNYSATWRKRLQIMAVQELNESLQASKSIRFGSQQDIHVWSSWTYGILRLQAASN